MKKHAKSLASYLRRPLMEPRAIIFGIALLHLIVTQVWVSRWYQQFGNGPMGAYPDFLLNAPYLLVSASLMLLLRRWWSYLLALVVSGWMLYSLSYDALHAVALAHDQPLFSFHVARLWLNQKYVGQPQEFLQLALSFVIFSYVIVELSLHWWRGGGLRAE